MKQLILITSLVVFSFTTSAQKSTSCDTVKVVFNDWLIKPPKRIFSVAVSPFPIGYGIGLEYGRLLENHKGNRLYRFNSKARYLAMSCDYAYNDFVARKLNQVELVEVFDSVAVFRSDYAITQQGNFRLGQTWLNRRIDLGMLRHSYAGLYGLVGYRSEQYGYDPLLVEMDGGVSEDYINAIELNSFGRRQLSYINLGVGGMLGMDWVVAFDADSEAAQRPSLSVGVVANVAFGAKVKLLDEIIEDSDLIYSGQSVDNVSGVSWVSVACKISWLF